MVSRALKIKEFYCGGVTFTPPIELGLWREVAATECFKNISKFIYCAPMIISEVCGDVVVGVSFKMVGVYVDGGVFDGAIAPFSKIMSHLIDGPLDMSFILEEEHSGNRVMYQVLEDGVVTVSDGVVIYPNIVKLLKP